MSESSLLPDFNINMPQHFPPQRHADRTTTSLFHHSCVPTWSQHQCGPPLAAHVAPQSAWGPVRPVARPQSNHHPAASPPSTILGAHIQNHSSGFRGSSFNFLCLSSASSTLMEGCQAHSDGHEVKFHHEKIKSVFNKQDIEPSSVAVVESNPLSSVIWRFNILTVHL